MYFLPACAETLSGDTAAIRIPMSFEDYLARREETWFLTGKKNTVLFPAYYDTSHCLIWPESDGM